MTKRRFCGFFGLLPPFWFFFCYIKVTAHTHTSILVTKSQLNKWPKKYKLADMSMNVFGCFRVNWTRFSLCSFLVCVRQSVQSDDKLLFLFYRIFADLCAKVADALHDEKSTTFSFSLPRKIACCSSICTDMCSMLVHFFTFFFSSGGKTWSKCRIHEISLSTNVTWMRLANRCTLCFERKVSSAAFMIQF